jgi:glycosyltransferase involved in cell wall biosynthesis
MPGSLGENMPKLGTAVLAVDAIEAGRVRVLHVITRYHRGGGAERNLMYSIEWEQRAGFDVHLAVGGDADLASLSGQVTVHQVRQLVRQVRPGADLVALRELRRLIRHGQFALVHTHESKAGILGRLAARGVARRIVHTVHMMSFGQSYSWVGSRAFLEAERYCARFTDRIISVGAEMRDTYIAARVGSPECHTLIHSPIDIDTFTKTREWTPEERLAGRRRLGFGIQPRSIVTIGALEPRKRQALLIEKLGPLLKAEAIELVVAGEGPEQDALESLVRRLSLDRFVVFLGHVSDIATVLAGSALLVHAATAEGVSQVVVQASAAGLPVVATDVMGLREIPGARVTVADRSGQDLLRHVRKEVTLARRPVGIEALQPWTAGVIDRQLTALHSELGLDG